MISQFLASVNVKNGSEIWLGGRQMDFHNFNWGDGSVFNYSYWEHGEPNFPAEKCIEMSWRNGRWNDINCRLKRAVLCEKQVISTTRISGKPILYNFCSEGDMKSNCTKNFEQPATSLATGQTIVATIDGGNHNDIGNHNLTLLLNSNSTSATNETLLIGDKKVVVSEDQTFVEDKPIKVIASIMHREQRPTIDSSVMPDNLTSILVGAQESSIDGSINGTFVHYSLPPPSSNQDHQRHHHHHQQQQQQQHGDISVTSSLHEATNSQQVPNSSPSAPVTASEPVSQAGPAQLSAEPNNNSTLRSILVGSGSVNLNNTSVETWTNSSQNNN